MNVRIAALWMMGIQYLSFATQFVTSALIARYYLGPQEIGIFSVGMAFTLMLSVFQDFGLSRYITCAEKVDDRDIQRFNAVALVAGLAVCTAVVVAAYPMSAIYKMPDLVPVLWITGASCFVTSFSVVPLALMARALRYRQSGLVQLAANMSQALGALSLAALGQSLMALAWAGLFSALVRSGLAQIMFPTIGQPVRIKGAGRIARFGYGMTILNLSGTLGTRTPDLLVGKFLGFGAVGLFSRAVSLSDQLRTLLAGSVGSVLLPAFARIHHRGDAMADAYLKVCAAYSAIIWPSMAGLAMVSAPLIHLLYGPNWSGAAPVLSLIAAAEIILVSLPMVSELPILAGKLKRLLLLNILDTALSLSLLSLACLWSLEAAAASRIVYAIGWLAIYFPLMRAIIGFDVRALGQIYLRSGLATAAAVTPLGFMFCIGYPPASLGLGTLGLGIGLGILAWAVALLVTQHPIVREIKTMAGGGGALPFQHSKRAPAP